MTVMDLLKVYAEVNDISWLQAKYEWDKGIISPYELLDCWLHYEGIRGYTQILITAFRAAYNIDQ